MSFRLPRARSRRSALGGSRAGANGPIPGSMPAWRRMCARIEERPMTSIFRRSAYPSLRLVIALSTLCCSAPPPNSARSLKTFAAGAAAPAMTSRSPTVQPWTGPCDDRKLGQGLRHRPRRPARRRLPNRGLPICRLAGAPRVAVTPDSAGGGSDGSRCALGTDPFVCLVERRGAAGAPPPGHLPVRPSPLLR